MKSGIVVPLVIASLLAASAPAFAQQHHDDHGGAQPSHGQPGHDHGAPHGHSRGPAPREASIGGPGGPIPHNDWHKGERLPQEYRDRSYVVDDWHGHGLQAPPRGYQWVGVNGDYVLAAVATGVIASVLLSGH
ncbi:RcnB family protein [Paraburkholderia sp.]|jgi:Ni/Co efflux regulator RcnB|uniref:RcnB family protein n=1 Tax=Paraburkholderia sp. TaxID=1926495 RepID=UPI002F429A0B